MGGRGGGGGGGCSGALLRLSLRGRSGAWYRGGLMVGLSVGCWIGGGTECVERGSDGGVWACVGVCICGGGGGGPWSTPFSMADCLRSPSILCNSCFLRSVTLGNAIPLPRRCCLTSDPYFSSASSLHFLKRANAFSRSSVGANIGRVNTRSTSCQSLSASMKMASLAASACWWGVMCGCIGGWAIAMGKCCGGC